MVSVENFYWIIWNQLLKPFDIYESHFFPFGTTSTDNLVNRSYSNNYPDSELLWTHGKLQSMVLFYDQEPLNANDVENAIFYSVSHKWFKNFRMIANSEISTLKKEIFRKNRVYDWYYFYHGFAALDWFRDLEYIDSSDSFKYRYISLNHIITGDRSYRMALTARLINLNIHDQGLVSFHCSENDCLNEINNPDSNLSIADKLTIRRAMPEISKKRIIDRELDISQSSASVSFDEFRLWQSAFLHVVNETVFFHEKLHLTEKIFKPIVSMRPFILVAAPGNLAYLKKYGFKTFSNWINESYDLETNHTKRLDLIAHEIARFSSMSQPELNKIYQEMKEVLEYNKNHFFTEFKKIIVTEMVDNLLGCINQWNNGRLDRVINQPFNREKAIQTLLY